MTPTHLLVCDDERHIVRLIQVNLERQGWRVTTAFAGQEALEKMSVDRPDLVVLDSEMPGMSGQEVLQEMGKDPELASIKVIMLGDRSKDDDGPGDTPGPTMYLKKPFDLREIIRLLGS